MQFATAVQASNRQTTANRSSFWFPPPVSDSLRTTEGTVPLRRRASSPCTKQGTKTRQEPWKTQQTGPLPPHQSNRAVTGHAAHYAGETWFCGALSELAGLLSTESFEELLQGPIASPSRRFSPGPRARAALAILPPLAGHLAYELSWLGCGVVGSPPTVRSCCTAFQRLQGAGLHFCPRMQ